MSRARKELNGDDKVAILLFALGPEAAAPIVQSLDDKALTRLSRRMSELGIIEPEILNTVLSEYLDIHESDDPMYHSDRNNVTNLLHYAMDQERAQQILEDIDKPKVLTVWEKLSRIAPPVIKSYIETEHPQTIALILGNLDTSVASQVIALLDEEVQMSVVMRMSKIESVPQELVRDIEETLEKELSEVTGSAGISFDGMVNVVEILKSLDKDVSKPLMERLEQKDEELFSQVDKLLLVFEDLLDLSDKDIQTILKHVSSDELVKALKGAPDDLADRFFANMSKRAAEIMREDMEVMPPLKLVEVEDSQQSILKAVRKLDDDGAITLTATDDMV
ncbi:MAG: flagellar motor switch protein FliG [Mariprofundaceae bacterium]